MILRKDTNDELMYRQRETYKPLFEGLEKCKLLDLGAHAGFITLYGFEIKSLARAVCVEASAYNFVTLTQNLKNFNARIVHGFITDNEAFLKEKIITIYGSKKEPCNDSFIEAKKHSYSELAKVISFKKLVNREKPDLIKIDIEYGERHLDFTAIPKETKRVTVEFHPINKKNCSRIYNELLDLGFQANMALPPNKTSLITFSR